MAPRGWVSWSSGKDAALARHAVTAVEEPAVEVVGLLTTVDEATGRVPVHGVPLELVRAQAAALDLPLHSVALPWPCPNAEYESRVRAALSGADGPAMVVFGDLHLADVRAYRERLLAPTGVVPHFPLWGRPTAALARDAMAAGLRAVITCVDPARVPPSLLGRPFDEQFLAALPPGVDPCGEGGEFHTFVVDAPGFRSAVEVAVGGTVERDGLLVAELTPA